MSKIYNFIKECGAFFVLTINDNSPTGRPFGAIMECNNKLYISTSDMKSVYKQLTEHNKVQIVAIKNGTRDWVRVSGVANECIDLNIKQRMLDECPSLKRYFSSADAPHYKLFQIEITNSEFYK